MARARPKTVRLDRCIILLGSAFLAYQAQATTGTSATPVGPTSTFPLEGRFVQADQDMDRASIEEGIERVAQAFNPLLRPVIRPYLRHVTRYCPVPVFTMSDNALTFACGNTTVFTSSYDGRPFDWQAIRDDETYRVSQNLVRPDKLVQTFANELGGREQTFELQPYGATLLSRVTYRSDYLPVPISYELRFQRAE